MHIILKERIYSCMQFSDNHADEHNQCVQRYVVIRRLFVF